MTIWSFNNNLIYLKRYSLFHNVRQIVEARAKIGLLARQNRQSQASNDW